MLLLASGGELRLSSMPEIITEAHVGATGVAD
jgi:hypothetical protein